MDRLNLYLSSTANKAREPVTVGHCMFLSKRFAHYNPPVDVFHVIIIVIEKWIDFILSVFQVQDTTQGHDPYCAKAGR